MNYYRKTVNNTANDVKLKMQMRALTVKITENINKLNDLLEVDKNINTEIDNNLKLINSNKKNISNIENTIKNHNTDIIKIQDIENNTSDINSNIKDIPNMKNTLDNLKYRQGAINLILNQLTPLKDIANDNADNITNNYNISQINKKI